MRVLVATDGSEAGAVGVEIAAGIPWPEDSLIRVAEAIDPGAALIGMTWPAPGVVDLDRLETDLRSGAERNVSAARARLERAGLRTEAVVLTGRPATAIVDQARAMGADLIVVGSRGHGTIESMLLGSVSAEVVDHAPVPVLVARGKRIDRVVLAWDGSPCAGLAADLVTDWSIFNASTVRVVSVAKIGIPWWTGFPEPGSAEMMPMYIDAARAARAERDTLAHDMRQRLQAIGRSVEDDCRDGDPATEILAAARETTADLIVMGSHGRTGLTRLVLGSVARNVLQHATCSVLVVRDVTAGSGKPLPAGPTAETREPTAGRT
jgi:nucleotide-binding universal stress UspA family protein